MKIPIFLFVAFFLTVTAMVLRPLTFAQQQEKQHSNPELKEFLQTNIEDLAKIRGQLLFSDHVADSLLRSAMIKNIKKLNSLK